MKMKNEVVKRVYRQTQNPRTEILSLKCFFRQRDAFKPQHVSLKIAFIRGLFQCISLNLCGIRMRLLFTVYV